MNQTSAQNLRMVTPPMVECVSLERIRQHLRLTPDGSPASHPDDALVQDYLKVARERLHTLNISMVPATYELRLDRFPLHEIRLPKPPLIEVGSVNYSDLNGNELTIDDNNYVVENDFATGSLVPDGAPPYAWILPVSGFSWPATMETVGAVRIQFRAGYASGTSPEDGTGVPFALRAAMLLMIGDLYQNRESIIVGTTAQELPNSLRALLEIYYLGTWTF